MTDSEKLLAEMISKLELIKETDIPSIDLYMDQVTTFMDTHLKCRKRFDDDEILTKTMINSRDRGQDSPGNNGAGKKEIFQTAYYHVDLYLLF